MVTRKYCLNNVSVIFYLALVCCIVVYIDDRSHVPEIVRSHVPDVVSDRVKRTLEQCQILQDQIRDGQYPYHERQYPLSGLSNPPQLNISRVSDQYKVSVCVPYKCGSETWRYLLRTLDNDTGDTIHDAPESWDQIRDYHHVIQVREPYERLLSAYRFIFRGERRGNMNLNKLLLETYSHLPSDKVDKGQEVVSFPQFLQSIVSGWDDMASDNVKMLTSGSALHWLPYYLQCNPCHPTYQPHTIIHLDTWTEDTTELLHGLGVNTNR